MRRKKSKESVLHQLGQTLTTTYSGVDKILLDTGPQKGKYRVVANLKRKTCPECKAVHYSSLPRNTCIGCTFILEEEKRLGRGMRPQERTKLLRKAGL